MASNTVLSVLPGPAIAALAPCLVAGSMTGLERESPHGPHAP